jgi:hypothetical protein
VTITATDSKSATATATFNVIVANVNPRVTDSLLVLYDFAGVTPSLNATIPDVSGTVPAMNLSVTRTNGGLTSGSGFITVSSSADFTIRTSGAASKILNTASGSGAKAISVELWIKPTNASNTGRGIFSIANDTSTSNSDRDISIVQDAGKYTYYVRTASGSVVSLQTNVTNNALTHLILVYTAKSNGKADITIYQNGSVALTQTNINPGSFAAWNTGYKLYVGTEATSSNSNDWTGELHLIGVYGKALSQAEVTQNYNAGANP